MSKFENFSVIEVGDVFTRVDKNGKVWKAEVIARTEFYVDVKKYHPYEVRFQVSEWKTEKRIPEPTTERCMLYQKHIEVETDEIVKSIWGEYKKTIRVPTNTYQIAVKEDYSKYPQYDKIYTLIKGE